MHPSRSVHHNETNPDLREKLFRSICEACDKLIGEWDENAWEDQFLTQPLSISEVVPASDSRFTVTENMRRFESFLEVVLRSCFLPKHQLPVLNVVNSGKRSGSDTWKNTEIRQKTARIRPGHSSSRFSSSSTVH
jgi:hypothetical protein